MQVRADGLVGCRRRPHVPSLPPVTPHWDAPLPAAHPLRARRRLHGLPRPPPAGPQVEPGRAGQRSSQDGRVHQPATRGEVWDVVDEGKQARCMHGGQTCKAPLGARQGRAVSVGFRRSFLPPGPSCCLSRSGCTTRLSKTFRHYGVINKTTRFWSCSTFFTNETASSSASAGKRPAPCPDNAAPRLRPLRPGARLQPVGAPGHAAGRSCCALCRLLCPCRRLGFTCMQDPFDLLAIQNLIFELKPDLLIETGTANGGSALLWSSILEISDLHDSRCERGCSG